MLARRRWSSLAFLICAVVLPRVTRAQCHKPSPTGVARADTLRAFETWVTPADSSISLPEHSAGNAVTFRVGNTGDCQDWAYFSAWGDGTVGIGPNGQVDSIRPEQVDLSPGFAANVTVYFSVGGQPGGGLYLQSSGGGTGAYTVTAIAAPPGNGPVLDLAHSYIGTNHDVARCVANCFDVGASYSTAPYYSTDAPQSITLAYRSAVAYPRGFVSVFAYDTTTVPPMRMSVQLKRPDGTSVRFLNDSTEMFFSCDSTDGHSSCNAASYAWLAVQYDASTDTTGAYPLTLLVRSYRDSTSYRQTRADIMALVDNERTSPFGIGWMLAGYQRLHEGPGNSFVITDGNGSIAYFAKTLGAPTWLSPPGDFSTLDCCNLDNDSANVRRRYPDGTTIGFRGDGRMVYLQDRHGDKKKFLHRGNALVAVRDVAGKDDSLGYVNGTLHWIKDPGGRVDSITIDGSNNLIRIKDPAGGLPFQGTYDNYNRLLQRIDRGGGVWGLAYDFANKLESDTTPAITTLSGPKRLVTRSISLETALLGNATQGTWDDPLQVRTSFTGHATVFNPYGYATTYVLDRFRQPAGITEPLGRTTSAVYDAQGRRTFYQSPAGQATRYTWDGPNLIRVQDSTAGHASGKTVNYVYDLTHNQVTLVSGDVDSVRTVLTSDKTAPDTVFTAGVPAKTHYSYNRVHHWYWACTLVMRSSTDYVSTCQYPDTGGFRNRDSVVTYATTPVQDPAPVPVTRYQYDQYGRTTRVINPMQDTTWMEYDVLNRVVRAIGPLHDTTTYYYGPLYLDSLKDATGQRYRVKANALGQPDSTQDPAGKVTKFLYDSGGNQVQIVNRRGQPITVTYDSLDQLRTRVMGTDTTRFFTDPAGRFTMTANMASVDTVYADSMGRPMLEVSCRVLVAPNPAQCYRDSSVYDIRRGLRTKLAVTAPGVWGPTWAYWANYVYHSAYSRLDSLQNFTGQWETFLYTKEGLDSIHTFRTLNNLTITYNRARWLQSQTGLQFSDATVNALAGSSVILDSVGRIRGHFHGTAATPDSERVAVFDHGGRLVQHHDSAYTWSAAGCSFLQLGATCEFSQVATRDTGRTHATYGYDLVGNRTDGAADSVAPGNRLIRYKNFRMDYDADGNLVRKRRLKADTTQVPFETDSLFWNAVGQLVGIKVFDSTGAFFNFLQYDYDGWGRRVSRRVFGFPASRNWALWDGNNLIFELDSLGARRTYYTYYPGTPQPQSVAFTTAGGDTTLYYVTDAQHNVVALLQPTGGSPAIRNQFRYGPFGDSLSFTGSGFQGNYVRYKGAYWDAQYNGPKFVLMGVRFYDPDVGRFISEDPIGLQGGINQYAFAGNDPVTGWDPGGTNPSDPGSEPCYTYYCPIDGITVTGTQDPIIGIVASILGGGAAIYFAWAAQATIAAPLAHSLSCPMVPQAPSGEDINANIRKTLGSVRNDWFRSEAYTEWYHNVKNRGPWDYKWADNRNTFGNAGNFNYGGTGKALGFSDETLYRAAGWVQQHRNVRQAILAQIHGFPYGENLDDWPDVMAGIQHFTNGCF